MSAALTATDTTLLYVAARDALAQSYAPYSKFRVAAALRSDTGAIITGVNMENAAYPQTICAERTAFATAITRGLRSFTDIAIIYHDDEHPQGGLGPIRPCGGCLSVMLEFSEERTLRIHCLDPHGRAEILTLGQLMPFPFTYHHPG